MATIHLPPTHSLAWAR